MATIALHNQKQSGTMEVDDSRQSSLANWSPDTPSPEPTPGSLLSQGRMLAGSAFEVQAVVLSRTRAVILIATLSGITFVGSMSGGLLTIGLPWIAADLNLPDNLLLWYVGL